LQLPPELRAEALPAMLLQPLVENALQHGVAKRPGPATVAVIARRDAQGLVIEVCNSGRLGVESPIGGRSASGYGLQHVRERLAALYGRAASCNVVETSVPEVRVTLHLPA
jgi:LytS/YehU family sensor histidine kinase